MDLFEKLPQLLIMKLINDNIYWHGTDNFCNCLNRLLLEILGCGPEKIRKILFCKVKVFPHLGELSQKQLFPILL
jgi:hypothetical protein